MVIREKVLFCKNKFSFQCKQQVSGSSPILMKRNHYSLLFLVTQAILSTQWLTWFRGPLKDGDTPLPMIFSLRDSDSELIHAVSWQGVNHHSSLVAVLVLPACWFTLFPEPYCVGSVLKEKKVCFIPDERVIVFPFLSFTFFPFMFH